MADQWYGGQSSRGERWNVNLPAVVGVVFVFLLGVVIWVVASSGGGDHAIETSGTTVPPSSTTALTSVPPSTSPQPMPVTTPPPAPATVPPTVPATLPPTVPPTAPPAPPPPPAPTTTAVATTVAAPTPTVPVTAPPPAAANGDLGVPGHPIQKPACDGGYITVIASAVGDEATAPSLDAVLDRYAGSNYLRTDQTCPSLTPAIDGEPIYVVYLGPYPADTDACRARTQGPSGSYVRRLSNDLTPGHSVTCA